MKLSCRAYLIMIAQDDTLRLARAEQINRPVSKGAERYCSSTLGRPDRSREMSFSLRLKLALAIGDCYTVEGDERCQDTTCFIISLFEASCIYCTASTW